MSGTDLSLLLRQSLVVALRADTGLEAIVGARVYGENAPASPQWPFIRVEIVTTEPYEATCYDGSASRVNIHAFAAGPSTDAIGALRKAIVDALKADVAVTGASMLSLDWRNTNTIPDGDSTAGWHAIIAYDARVVVKE